MTARRAALAALLAVAVAGCRKSRSDQTGTADLSGTPADQEPPVAINGDSPIQYPPRLYDQRVEGDVVLRLFVDSTGRLALESTRVAESSGYPALDSAALSGARRLRFTPARRHGLPIATAFLQPIEFRHPQASTAVRKGEPDTVKPRPATPPPARVAAPSPTPAPAATTVAPPSQPVRASRRDSTPVRRDTTPGPDTNRTGADSARAASDTSARPH